MLSPGRIREIAMCSLQALAHLHRRGVCIRDLKPANLLVRRPGGEVVVADLGLATRSDSGGCLEGQLWAGRYATWPLRRLQNVAAAGSSSRPPATCRLASSRSTGPHSGLC